MLTPGVDAHNQMLPPQSTNVIQKYGQTGIFGIMNDVTDKVAKLDDATDKHKTLKKGMTQIHESFQDLVKVVRARRDVKPDLIVEAFTSLAASAIRAAYDMSHALSNNGAIPCELPEKPKRKKKKSRPIR